MSTMYFEVWCTIRYPSLNWQILLSWLLCSFIYTRTLLLLQPLPGIWRRGTILNLLFQSYASFTSYILESGAKNSVRPYG